MPASPSEPEKYSIDEIMDRLKSAPSAAPEDGELVTRTDGSQAFRVRKRKRRSSQPIKESQQRTRRARIVQVSAALILIFLSALTIGGAIVYANSRPFREGLIRKIEQASGASVELQEFRMNPKTANAGQLSLKWPDGNVLQNLSLRRLSAEISPSSFWGKFMTGEEITVQEGSLALQIPKPGQVLRSTPELEGPLSIRFNRYRTPTFELTLGDLKSPLLKLSKSEASLNPETVNGRPQMNLYRGDLAIAGWPKLRLDRALIEFHGKETDIISLRVLHESDARGVFELSGTISPYQAERASTLDVVLDFFELSGITGPALGHLFSGRIDSLPLAKSNVLSFLPSEDSSPTLDIAFHQSPTSKIEIQGFPFLSALAQTLDDPWFQHPSFEADAVGTLHRENGRVTLQNLNFESKGRMALRGEISMAANQTLSGNLQLGVTEAMISSATTPRLKTMFGPPKEGFRWLTLKIGGPVTSPTDNFRELFTSAVAAPPDSPAPAAVEGSSFDELTHPK
jgi:hypothetical protein